MKLFEPITINQLTLPNRIIKSAMAEGMADERGMILPQMVEAYRRWARGGVALSITGMMSVLEGFKLSDYEAGLYHDDHIEPLARLTDAVHQEGGRVFVQLCHAPPQMLRRRAQKLGSLAPSRGLNRTNFLMDRPFSDGELREVVRAFGYAARRAQRAGADGIQLHAAHGYMLSRFLSPRFNRRDDDWGGSFGRRFALLKDVYETIRDAVGNDFPVTIKLNAHDGDIRGGLTLDESLEIGRQLVAWGIDAIEVSAGTGDVGMGFYANRGDIPMELAMRFLNKELPVNKLISPALKPIIQQRSQAVKLKEEGYFLREAELFANSLDVPIIAVGGFRSRTFAEKVLNETAISMIAMARPFICQSNLVNEWRKEASTKSKCISCNRCFIQVGLGESLLCTGVRP